MDTVYVLFTLIAIFGAGIVAYGFGRMQERIKQLEANYGHTKMARVNKAQNESEQFPLSSAFQMILDADTELENALLKHRLGLAAMEKYRRFKIHLTNGGDPDAPESAWINPNNKSGGKSK